MIKRDWKQKKRNLWPFFIIGGIIVLFLILYLIGKSDPERLGFGNVALIKINGEITTEENSFPLGNQIVSSSEIVSYLEEADKNPQVKAILIEINSPGGSPVASEEIATALKKIKKPKIALIRDIGTSGAYWVASAADEIIASPVSITGSIGVTGSYLQFSGLLQKYGVGYEEIKSGEYKEIGSPYRNLTNEERQILQDAIMQTHQYFVKNVAENRNMSLEDVENLATGQFFTGQDAKYYGLIDDLGGKDRAESILKEKLGTETITYLTYQQDQTFLDKFSQALSRQSFSVGEGIGNALLKQGSSQSISIKA